MIEHTLPFYPKILHNSKDGYYMSYISGTIENQHTERRCLVAYNFIIDTGAAISILNHNFNFLFNEGTTPVVDYVDVHYGGGIAKNPLPVYKVKLKLKGEEFEILAAHDQNMKLTSLLGHYSFLNELQFIGIRKKKRTLTIVK